MTNTHSAPRREQDVNRAPRSWGGPFEVGGIPDRMRDKHDSRRSQVFARNRRLIDGHAEVLTRDRIFASRCAIFRDLAPAGLESLVRSARRRLIDKGEFFYRQGDPATDVYVLTDGTLKLVARSEDGRGVILDLVTPGQPFGHVAALVDGARLVSAVALEDSRALAWDTSAILRLMTTLPRWPYRPCV